MGAIVLWLVIIFAVVAYNKKSVTIKNPARPDAAKGQQGGQAAGSVKKEPNPWDAYQPSDERGRRAAGGSRRRHAASESRGRRHGASVRRRKRAVSESRRRQHIGGSRREDNFSGGRRRQLLWPHWRKGCF